MVIAQRVDRPLPTIREPDGPCGHDPDSAGDTASFGSRSRQEPGKHNVYAPVVSNHAGRSKRTRADLPRVSASGNRRQEDTHFAGQPGAAMTRESSSAPQWFFSTRRRGKLGNPPSPWGSLTRSGRSLIQCQRKLVPSLNRVGNCAYFWPGVSHSTGKEPKLSLSRPACLRRFVRFVRVREWAR
jgi:hypothetical protein